MDLSSVYLEGPVRWNLWYVSRKLNIGLPTFLQASVHKKKNWDEQPLGRVDFGGTWANGQCFGGGLWNAKLNPRQGRSGVHFSVTWWSPLLTSLCLKTLAWYLLWGQGRGGGVGIKGRPAEGSPSLCSFLNLFFAPMRNHNLISPALPAERKASNYLGERGMKNEIYSFFFCFRYFPI